VGGIPVREKVGTPGDEEDSDCFVQPSTPSLGKLTRLVLRILRGAVKKNLKSLTTPIMPF
jgi:hypothetical protein